MNAPRWTVAGLALLAVLGSGCASSTPEPATLATLSLSPASVEGGGPSTGTLALTGPAPEGGAIIALASSLPAATVPSTATVAGGATSATFTVTTTAVADDALATITASLAGASRTASLAVMAPPASLSSVVLSPPAVEGGAGSTGTVTLTRPAPSGGAIVTLSSNIASATVPASTTVPAGSAGSTFAVTTVPVAESATATITATYAGGTRTALLAVTPLPPPPLPSLSSVTVSPSSVVGGTGATGTIELSFAAPAGGAVVGLSSSLASVSVPGTATIAEGATSTTFALTTSPVATEETATIAAVYAGGTRTTTLAVTPPPPCALRTAGAQWIAFSSKRTGVYDIYAMRADGTCLTQVTNDAADDLFATWSPAGTIAYMSARSGRMQIYVRDFTSGDERLLDVGDLTATSPAFSPDGTRVAFEGYAPGVTAVSDVYVVPAAGGVPVKLTTGQKYSAGPAWSPDGSTVYFVSNRVSGYNVWTVPAAGGAETLVPGTAGILGRPAATPDGTGIAFTLPAAGAAFSKVVLLNISTGAVRTVSSQSDGEPTLDRTGSRMAVTSFRGGNADVWLLDVATGAEVRQLTDDPGVDGAAAFGPFP